MRIGLLECDHVAERYLPIAGDYSHMFTAMVADADPDAEVVVYDALRRRAPGQPRCLRRVALHRLERARCTTPSRGSSRWPASCETSTRPRALRRRVLRPPAHRPRPRRTHRAGARRVGSRRLRTEFTDPAPWMHPPLPAATLLYSHQDQVTQLPPGGRVLAAAPHCPVAMLAVGHDVIGVQAHPEFGAPYIRALLEDRVDRIGEAGTAVALASLAQPTDERPWPVDRLVRALPGAATRANPAAEPSHSSAFSLTDPDIGARFEVSDPSTGRLLVRPLGAPPRRTEGGPTDARWSHEPERSPPGR